MNGLTPLKKTISVVIIVLVVIVSAYIFYYSRILEDEYTVYSSNYIFESTNNTLLTADIYLYDFQKDSCEFVYCIYNACKNSFTLPCEKISLNEYNKDTFYTVKLEFKYYMILPFGKRYLNNIQISISDKSQLSIKDKYIAGIKSILSKYPIREGYKCAYYLEDEDNSFICNYDTSFDNEYFQSIYLTYVLGTNIKDEELINWSNEEIKYLNSNKVDILSKNIELPQAYILELVNIGLDREYLKLIDGFEIPENEINDLKYNTREELYSREKDLQFNQYQSIIRYIDYVEVLSKYGKNELSEYFLNEINNKYNSLSLGLYSLCSIGNLNKSEKIFEYLKGSIESSIKEQDDLLLFNSPLELQECEVYATSMEQVINGIDESISEAIRMSTFILDELSFLIDTTYVCTKGLNDCNTIILNFRLLDNLKYVLYE